MSNVLYERFTTISKFKLDGNWAIKENISNNLALLGSQVFMVVILGDRNVSITTTRKFNYK